MEQWVILVLIYGILKGIRDVMKKKALMKSTVIEVLFFYTLIGFLCVAPKTKEAFNVDMHYMGWFFGKAFIIFIAFLCSFTAIKKLPISLYGVMDLARVLFSMLLGVLVLKETMGVAQIIGLILVMGGLLLVNKKKKGQSRKVDRSYVILMLISCLLNAISGLMDKILMSKDISSVQLQYWYMFWMVLMYFVYILAARVKVNWKELLKNYWILFLGVSFVLADRALFIANQSADSKITVMTLIKQSSVIITILAGKFVFKEKDILYRMFCGAIVVAGIVIAVL